GGKKRFVVEKRAEKSHANCVLRMPMTLLTIALLLSCVVDSCVVADPPFVYKFRVISLGLSLVFRHFPGFLTVIFSM
ncbi:hypothetical protein, partial [Klebsiella pneumoniae]|uniref:hypothetical protein n=1 Tax=Klebsiella pneumoniae TaxID=573 RepID=UPI003013A8E9